MTLDEAINKFRDYAQGKGDFDELDLKEVIVDNRDKAVREALASRCSVPNLDVIVCHDIRPNVQRLSKRTGDKT